MAQKYNFLDKRMGTESKTPLQKNHARLDKRKGTVLIYLTAPFHL